jgi:hypothetical protein
VLIRRCMGSEWQGVNSDKKLGSFLSERIESIYRVPLPKLSSGAPDALTNHIPT